MERACPLCAAIGATDAGTNVAFVARLPGGDVVLDPRSQYYPGYTLFIARHCVRELHELSPRGRSVFLKDMALVAEAVFRAFKPAKLNYELLGNSAPHLHWHLVPRPKDDPKPGGPIWEDEHFLSSLRSGRPAAAGALRRPKERLLRELERVAGDRLVASYRARR